MYTFTQEVFVMLDLYVNIKNRRKELGMTQTELAEKTGYSNKSSIATIEAGKIDLPLSKVKEFAKALDCSADYLMGWNDENDEITLEDILDVPIDLKKFKDKYIQKNVNISEFSVATGIRENVINYMLELRPNYSRLTKKQFKCVCDYLQVSPYFLRTNLEDNIKNNALQTVANIKENYLSKCSNISNEEEDIILAYRASDDLTKAMVCRALGLDTKE